MALTLRGGLLVAGTTSDAGKSWLVAGLCRLLAREGVAVAPFKAQNMSLNAAVTGDGAEIGHAQWVQALAAGVEAEAAMNPVLLKPLGERESQVVVMGRPAEARQARLDRIADVVEAHLDLDALWALVAEAAEPPRSGSAAPASVAWPRW